MNQAAVTIQRWYRRHARRRLASNTALRRFLASKRKVRLSPKSSVFPLPPWVRNICISTVVTHVCRLCQEWEESRLEQQQQQEQQQKVEDRKKLREEKARLARLAVIQVTLL